MEDPYFETHPRGGIKLSEEITVFKPVDAALNELAERFSGVVYSVGTPDGMSDAKAAYKVVNGYSITLEKARKDEKAESLAYGRHVDSEAARISGSLDALRLPIKEQIEVETKRVEREREAAVAAEKARIEAEAQAARDAEAATLAAAQADIKRQQEEIAEAAKQSQLRIEEAERESRLKIEATQRAAREADEAAAAERKAAQDKLDAERHALEETLRKARVAEQVAIDAAARKADAEEAAALRVKEAAQREALRLENELLDGRAMLETFVNRFGNRSDFAVITAGIREFLTTGGEA